MLLGSRSWLSIPLWWIGLCVLKNFGVKAELKVEFEDVTLLVLDPKYFDPAITDVFIKEHEDTGETTLECTAAIIKDLPVETNVRIGLKGLSMGKYTVPTGLEIKMNLCDMMNEQIIVGPFLNRMGFSEDACPPKLGVYSQEGYKLTADSLPDDFPENKYLAFYEMTVNNTHIVAANIHVNVEVE